MTMTSGVDGTDVIVKCGALLGLGPSWVILSILNSFAAEEAGASSSSYAVCGDDLVALWTRSQIEGYLAALPLLNLQGNRDKSFVGHENGNVRGIVFVCLVRKGAGDDRTAG